MKINIEMREAVEQATVARKRFLEWDEQEKHHHILYGMHEEKMLRQELDKLRALRITMRSNGDTGSRDYRDIVTRTAAIQTELEDIVYSRETRAPQAFQTQLSGLELYKQDASARRNVVTMMVQQAEAALNDQIDVILGPIYAYMAEGVALEDAMKATQDHFSRNPMPVTGHYEPGFKENESFKVRFLRWIAKHLEEVTLPAFEPDTEQAEILAMVSDSPSVNRLNYDLVGSPAKIHSARHEAEQLARQAQERDRAELESISMSAHLVE